MKLITTSWDDGHPKDLKLAELLDKYNLPGTFYIPKTNLEHPVMDENAVYDLSKKFEIGGHTLNHVRLYSTRSAGFLETEIKGCFDWLKDLQGFNPVSFCFPGGVLNKAAIGAARDTGFEVLRTTELLSTSIASADHLSPTTLQLFDHPRISYLKNLVKRQQYRSFVSWLAGTDGSNNIFRLVDFYLEQVEKNDGCFHLWGHSWEIEEYGLWKKLEMVFKRISGIAEFRYIQNRDLVST